MIYLLPTDDPLIVRNVLIASGEKVDMRTVVAALRQQLVLLVYKDRVLKGFVSFRAINEITQEIHLHLLEKGLGREVVAEAKNFMFAHTPTQKILALVPEHRIDVCNLALKCGFHSEGLLLDATIYKGVLEPLLIYGVNK